MKVTVIGTGYVGLVTGVCLAEVGNDVVCLDIDERKIEILNSGGVPIYEPGLDNLIKDNIARGTLKFTTDIKASVEHGDIQFIAVGTPPDEDGSADLQYVLAAARNIAKYMNGYKIVVDKSTVPVGTAEMVVSTMYEELINRGEQMYDFDVISNPEFLKEGHAIDDCMRPDRIVLGIAPGAEKAKATMKQLYSPFNRNHDRIIIMDVRSAEFTKYTANAMLATRISFMNELSRLAEATGVDIEAVRRGIGSDSRIGYNFLYAGCGYGGSCFPKDVQALIRTADQYGQKLSILEAVESVNYDQKHILVNKAVKQFGSLAGKKFAVWGLAFKPGTDDMREAPSRTVIKDILDLGGSVSVYDPVAMPEAVRVLQQDLTTDELIRVEFVSSAMQAVQDADALFIVTEWKEFKTPNFEMLKQQMKQAVIFDGRNLFDKATLDEHDFIYKAIGR
jgi:UDPglucose 6-dehydrogenase